MSERPAGIMTEREILEAVLSRVDEYSSAMSAPNNWTPQFRSLVIYARQELMRIDAALSKANHKE